MTKRLKRRIHEVCGLTKLSREDKVRKASTILADSDLKQKICNEIPGASHRDVEKALKALVTTKLSPEDELREELERDQPEKLDPEVTIRPSRKIALAPLVDRREVNNLVHATSKPLENKPAPRKEQDTYSPEEIRKLLESK